MHRNQWETNKEIHAKDARLTLSAESADFRRTSKLTQSFTVLFRWTSWTFLLLRILNIFRIVPTLFIASPLLLPLFLLSFSHDFFLFFCSRFHIFRRFSNTFSPFALFLYFCALPSGSFFAFIISYSIAASLALSRSAGNRTYCTQPPKLASAAFSPPLFERILHVKPRFAGARVQLTSAHGPH